ncbi:YigZ family protein [Paucilactobacillus sp. N302-9]
MTKPSLTIAHDHQSELIIKKSRFICSVFRIENEEMAKDFISVTKKEHRKANHNCFAYVLGDQDHIQRQSDDGEPSGTAGVPILESLQLTEVHNVLAIVTRYFGGIKLGAGGLIRAYSNATTQAIHEAGLVQKVLQASLAIEFAYQNHDTLTYFLQQQHLEIVDEQYGVDVTVTIFIDEKNVDAMKQKIVDLLHNQVSFALGEPRYHEIPFLG